MRSLLILTILALTFGYTLIQYGGVTAREWNFVLLSVCSLSLAMWIPGRTVEFAPALPAIQTILIAAIPAYIACQLVPLPLSWLEVLSPARAELAHSLTPFHAAIWTPVSVSPALTFAHLLRVLAYIVVFFLIREISFQLIDRIWLTALPILVAASMEGVIGIVQHYETGGAARGTYVNPDHFAGLLEMALPISVACALASIKKTSLEPRESLRAAARVCLLLACTALIILALVYSNSRMSIAVTAVSMTVLALLGFFASGYRRPGGSWMAAVAAMAFVLLAAPLSLLERYSRGLSSEARLTIWRDSLPLIRSYPVFGSGLGTFGSAFQRFASPAPGLVDFAHSDYLQLLAELGLTGFLVLAAAAMLGMKDGITAARAEYSETRSLLAGACSASIAAIAVHSLADFQFYIPANMMTAAWIAGLVSGIGASHGKGRRHPAQTFTAKLNSL